MSFNNVIQKLRKGIGLTQEQFAAEFNVSKQAVQKWESGTSYPEISKILEISKRFDISLDTILLDRDMRAVEELKHKTAITPNYSAMHDWELYVSAVLDEYRQSIDEGLDIEAYKDIFYDISKLPKSNIKKKFGDVIYDIVINAKQREGYKYIEPSELGNIRKLRKPYKAFTYNGKASLEEKIKGAWLGRLCGCLLGKPIEGIRHNELVALLKATGNFPMRRYILNSDIEKIDVSQYVFGLLNRPYGDIVDGMPVDDDTNYTALAQELINRYGRDFTPNDVAQIWLNLQPKDAYCTAERVAFCNFIKGYEPPFSAVYKNPYREFIGAQIRADYFGYINPGNPELAAEMAWRDASISHVKNGIYGEMFVAAMLAVAAVTNNIEDIILAGLAEIPHTSRLYDEVMQIYNLYKSGASHADCMKVVNELYDETTGYGWCHTNSNAMIVVAALLYGGGDYGKSICLAVETAFDTDCNGATVGSIVGMANGASCIPECWTKPINDTLHTTIIGVGSISVSKAVAKTLEHIK